MRLAKSNISCGIYQLDGFTFGDTPDLITKFVVKKLKNKEVMEEENKARGDANGWAYANARPPMIIFNTTDDSGHGERFAKYIEENNLGEICKIPHTNNCLRTID